LVVIERSHYSVDAMVGGCATLVHVSMASEFADLPGIQQSLALLNRRPPASRAST
jgi:hypothetical protein